MMTIESLRLRAAKRAFRLIATVATAAAINGQAYARGVVVTSTNSASGNGIVVFDRANDGALTLAATVPTGGMGTGGGLGNAGAITFAENGRWLLAVNAGTNDITVFKLEGDRLILTDREPSGGVKPVSVTADDDVVYVLNGGGTNNITGFRLTGRGQLRPIAGSTRPLSGAAVGPAQVGFTPDGSKLVVTEKGTNEIDTFLVNDDGMASTAIVNPSSGATPFGFAFDAQGRLFVSEAFGGAANGSAVSSYSIGEDGVLHPITASALTNQTAACWVAVSRSNNHVWTTNTGSGSVSVYDVLLDGELNLEANAGIAALTGAGSDPTDLDTTPNGRFVYVITPGIGSVEAFRVASDGGLSSIGVTAAGGTSLTGLLAR